MKNEITTLDSSNNTIRSNSSIRLAQETQLNQERITNLRISSASDICMVLIFIIGLGMIIYYIIFSLHIK